MFRKNTTQSIPEQIYGGLMAQARSPEFFAHIGVSDTVMGRFDMLAMHVYLLTRRLRQEDAPIAGDLAQDVFDLFVADVERALRELGVGDTTVPKRKKKMIHSFYAQIDEFDPVIEQDDVPGLMDRLKSRYFSENETANVSGLSQYMMRIVRDLDETDLNAILKAQVAWPDVSKFIGS